MNNSESIYTAFLSSTSDLEDIRKSILDELIDYSVFPFAMEHFAVDADEGFADIRRMIESSDFFLMILSLRYGSRDDTGKSWTQKEYEYCQTVKTSTNKGVKVWVGLTPELVRARDLYLRNPDMPVEELQALDPHQSVNDIRDQLKFVCSIHSPVPATDPYKLIRSCRNFVNRNTSQVSGWIRGMPVDSYYELEFGRPYYQVHMSEVAKGYLRLGMVTFLRGEQPGEIIANAENHKVSYNPADGTIELSQWDITRWQGTYLCQDRELVGIFSASKSTKGVFGDMEIEPGKKDGIHRFTILDKESGNRPIFIRGTFQDAADYHHPKSNYKTGRIFVFETETERIEFLKKYHHDVLMLNRANDGTAEF